MTNMDFRDLLDVVKTTYYQFQIAEGMTRVAVAVFGASTKVIFGFDEFSQVKGMDNALSGVTRPGGDAMVGSALRDAKKQIFNKARDGVPKRLIHMLCGRTKDDVIKPAAELRSADVTIVAAGACASVNKRDLCIIGSPPPCENAVMIKTTHPPKAPACEFADKILSDVPPKPTTPPTTAAPTTSSPRPSPSESSTQPPPTVCTSCHTTPSNATPLAPAQKFIAIYVPVPVPVPVRVPVPMHQQSPLPMPRPIPHAPHLATGQAVPQQAVPQWASPPIDTVSSITTSPIHHLAPPPGAIQSALQAHLTGGAGVLHRFGFPLYPVTMGMPGPLPVNPLSPDTNFVHPVTHHMVHGMTQGDHVAGTMHGVPLSDQMAGVADPMAMFQAGSLRHPGSLDDLTAAVLHPTGILNAAKFGHHEVDHPWPGGHVQISLLGAAFHDSSGETGKTLQAHDSDASQSLDVSLPNKGSQDSHVQPGFHDNSPSDHVVPVFHDGAHVEDMSDIRPPGSLGFHSNTNSSHETSQSYGLDDVSTDSQSYQNSVIGDNVLLYPAQKVSSDFTDHGTTGSEKHETKEQTGFDDDNWSGKNNQERVENVVSQNTQKSVSFSDSNEDVGNNNTMFSDLHSFDTPYDQDSARDTENDENTGANYDKPGIMLYHRKSARTGDKSRHVNQDDGTTGHNKKATYSKDDQEQYQEGKVLDEGNGYVPDSHEGKEKNEWDNYDGDNDDGDSKTIEANKDISVYHHSESLNDEEELHPPQLIRNSQSTLRHLRHGRARHRLKVPAHHRGRHRKNATPSSTDMARDGYHSDNEYGDLDGEDERPQRRHRHSYSKSNVGGCYDVDPACPTFLQSGWDCTGSSYGYSNQFLRENCRKSCGLCGRDDSDVVSSHTSHDGTIGGWADKTINGQTTLKYVLQEWKRKRNKLPKPKNVRYTT
ncbi:uncharacterized protein LOC125559841 [Nematostella vectensis]|uniref:uncharacterized protein LOC125559841 n=1 Tax=Nematostella vectensis TaxID=45351 RepID=UPI0020775D99|nr:uncharacterized protein LOC125559841 [Nematostella vectensis]